MKSVKCKWAAALLCGLLVVSLVSVSQAQESARTEIRIGASLPLSGSLADQGRVLKWAYEQAASEINAKGGIFVKDVGRKLEVRIVVADNGTNVMKAATTLEKLIKVDKVDLLLGDPEPTSVMAQCMVAERHKKYYHTSFGFPVQLWVAKKFKWSTDFFFDISEGAKAPFKLLSSINGTERPKRLAVAAEQTSIGEVWAHGFGKAAKENGFEAAFVITLPLGSTDYGPQISKMGEMEVDGLMLFAGTKDAESFVRGLKKNNVNIPYLYIWKGAWSGSFGKDLGKDAQYILCDGHWSMDYPFEGAKELGQKYYEAFGEYSVTVGVPYALAQILFQAVEKAGSVDGAKVRQAVLTHPFRTVMGEVTYNAEGLALYPQMAAQWWNGKQMIVYPGRYAVWKVRLAPPWARR
jgi:branched-chain amino acid transport system substrate-binding protein